MSNTPDQLEGVYRKLHNFISKKNYIGFKEAFNQKIGEITRASFVNAFLFRLLDKLPGTHPDTLAQLLQYGEFLPLTSQARRKATTRGFSNRTHTIWTATICTTDGMPT